MARKMKNSGIEWIGEIPEDWNVLPAYRVFSEVKKKNSDGTEQNALQFKFGAIIRKANFDAENDDYVAGTIAAYTVVEPGTVMVNGLNLNYDFKTQRTALVKEKGFRPILYTNGDYAASNACYKKVEYEQKGSLCSVGV